MERRKEEQVEVISVEQPQVSSDDLRRMIELVEEVHREYEVPEELEFVDRIDAQADRYDWFAERVGRVRKISRLVDVLSRPERAPGEWEQAMVELSIHASDRASLVLQRFVAPDPDSDLEIFLEVCRAKCERSD